MRVTRETLVASSNMAKLYNKAFVITHNKLPIIGISDPKYVYLRNKPKYKGKVRETLHLTTYGKRTHRYRSLC